MKCIDRFGLLFARLLWKLHDSIKNPAKIDLLSVNLIKAQGSWCTGNFVELVVGC
jgi:hypothetical protein